jgi:hypothetical protein
MQYMHLIPVTVLDNFFDDPDKIRRWALEQEYFSDPEGNWPGVRSKYISDLNKPFFHMVCHKFFSQFFDLKRDCDTTWEVTMHFQIIQGSYDSGWIHSDAKEAQITGIVYLSPNSNLNGGTSIYRERNNLIQSVYDNDEYKRNAYLNKMSIEEIKKYKEEHNAQYEETIRISNVYNRLISFDSHLHHAAQDFFGEDEDSRLTLVFFVNKLFVNNTPVSRVRRTIG